MLQQHIRVEEERVENDSEENVTLDKDKDWSLSEGRVNCNCLLRLSIKSLCVI